MAVAIGILVLSYLIGSVPTGYVLVRMAKGQDVRSIGSHSIGAINVFRIGGVWLGALTLVLDVGKALGVVLLASAVTRLPWVIASTALMVMLGHSYSAWLFLRERRFSEGKSVACCLGVMVGLACLDVLPVQLALLPLGVWAGVLVLPRLFTRRWLPISIATITAAISVPVAVWAGRPEMPYRALSLAMALLILLRHKNNFRRLLAGTEPRPGWPDTLVGPTAVTPERNKP